MIQVNPCRGCGRLLYEYKIANLDVRVETVPLDAGQAVDALVGGTPLWRVTFLGKRPGNLGSASPAVLAALRNAEPAERPVVVREHRCRADEALQRGCTAADALSRPPVAPTVQPAPPEPPAGQQTPFSGPSAAPSSASSAVTPVSDVRGPRCGRCKVNMQQGEYAAIEIGEILVWAEHLTGCVRS